MSSSPPPHSFSPPGPGSAHPPAFEDPPSYREQVDDPDELQQPIIFTLRGRFVYAPPDESSPLYELSRVIHAQGEATTTIEFQRLEYRVRTTNNGPTVAQRGKHLYNMMHVPIVFSQGYQCAMESVSRRGLGNVVLKKSPFPHSGYRAAAPTEKDLGFDVKTKKTAKAAKNDYFFLVKEKKGKAEDGCYEWTDTEGRVVATQVSSDLAEGPPVFKLIVGVPLTRRMLDGLVAVWCLWLWHIHATEIFHGKAFWKQTCKLHPHLSQAVDADITRVPKSNIHPSKWALIKSSARSNPCIGQENDGETRGRSNSMRIQTLIADP